MEILIVFFGLLLVLLLIGMPAGYAIAVTSVIAIAMKWGTGMVSLGLIAQMLVYGINNFPVLAVPLFLITGALMISGEIADRLFDFSNAVVGHIRGGLAQVNILASFIFSGMSGTAAGDVAALGQLEIRAMRRAGYDNAFACAVTGASSTIGPVVPPSVPLILYGVLANASVTKLFIAGIIPGLLLVAAFMMLVGFFAYRRNYPKEAQFSGARLWKTFKRALLPLFTPVIIIGGIWSGIFTPTEAAAIAAVYTLILGLGVYRTLKLVDLARLFRRSAIDSGIILFILAAAMIYNTALTRTQAPDLVMEALLQITRDPLAMLVLLNVILFIAGMFLSVSETILLLTPLIAPMLPQFGIDPIHFGILMVLNLMVGQMTPPFGIVLYILVRIGDIEFTELVRALVPFYIPIFVVIGLIIMFPALTTYLPGQVYGP